MIVTGWYVNKFTPITFYPSLKKGKDLLNTNYYVHTQPCDKIW